MDTNRMRYFLSLSRTGSITKSAELHSISPAAFSKAIRVFQEEIGHELTLPSGRGLILTDYAKSIVPEIESVIQQMDMIKKKADTHVFDRGSYLRIATFEVFSTHFMIKALSEFFPDYRCDLHEAIPGKMEELVATGKVNLALTYIPIPHSDLDHLKVQEIEMGIFGKKSLANKQKLSDLRFVVPICPIEGSPNKVKGLDGWPDDAFSRNNFYQVSMLETALGLCREGLAVAYLPKFVVNIHNEIIKREHQLIELPMPKNFPKTKSFVYLIKRKTDIEGTEAKRLAQAIRKFCR